MPAERHTRTPATLRDAALVHTARTELSALIDRWSATPLDPEIVVAVLRWLDDEYPTVAAALRRLDDPARTPNPPEPARPPNPPEPARPRARPRARRPPP